MQENHFNTETCNNILNTTPENQKMKPKVENCNLSTVKEMERRDQMGETQVGKMAQ